MHHSVREALHGIAKIQLQNLSQRLQEREMDIELSADALDYLSDIGFDVNGQLK